MWLGSKLLTTQVEQLKRENKLWSNDALVLREFLLVPVTKENSKCVPAGSEIVRAATLKSDTDSVRTASNSSSNGPCEDCDSERVSSTSAPDLSAKDFLNKYDSSIAQLKSNVQRMEESTR
uniref:LysM domain-containing protein n=1 Tax=Octopus bimaculoides TaxID=37653 RepID=A0A0L8GE12_OCTBM